MSPLEFQFGNTGVLSCSREFFFTFSALYQWFNDMAEDGKVGEYRSHDSDLVGDVECVLITCQLHVCFLVALWGDKGVDLLDLDSVK